MRLRLEYDTIGWWYWLATAVLLTAAQAGWPPGLAATLGLTAWQALHFALRASDRWPLSVQVRLAYLLLLVLGLWRPMAWIHWLQLGGVAVRVLSAYCFLARTLSLLPWNRRGPLTGSRLWRTYATPPTRGSIVQALDRQAAGAAR